MSPAIPSEHKKALKFIEDVTTNAGEIQHRVLSEILKQNSKAEYLRRHGLNGGGDDIAVFKKLMPMVTYEDLQPDILRIANGDESPILCCRPISEFITSSGTSGGERKLVPMIEEEQDRRSLFYSLLIPVMSQYVPGLDEGKGMYFLFVKSRNFIDRPFDPYDVRTSPTEAILCSDSYQSMYAQLLCGLLENSQVLRAGAVSASLKRTGNGWHMTSLQAH